MLDHGQFKAALFGQLITFAARGPWNDEAMKNGSREVGRAIEQVDKSQPWAQLSCLAGEAIMPPSTFDIFVKQSSIRRDAGLTALAVVICDSDIKNTIMHQLDNCYSQAGIDHAFFDDLESALHWLKTLGITSDIQQVRGFYQSVSFMPEGL